MKRLEWSSGTRAAAEGKDLASVARTLTEAELDFWLKRFRELPLYNETKILEAEADRRGQDWQCGPLFRTKGT